MVQEESLNVAFGLLREMASQGVEADATTYTTLFNLCAEARQGHQAHQLMQVQPMCVCVMHCYPGILASASSWWVCRNRQHKCHKHAQEALQGRGCSIFRWCKPVLKLTISTKASCAATALASAVLL